MGMRKLLAGALISVAVLLAVPNAAFADPAPAAAKELFECVEKATKDNEGAIAKDDYSGLRVRSKIARSRRA